MDFFTTGLGPTVSTTLDERTAQALGMNTTQSFTLPAMGSTAGGTGDSKMMLYIGIAGLLVVVAIYFKRGR